MELNQAWKKKKLVIIITFQKNGDNVIERY